MSGDRSQIGLEASSRTISTRGKSPRLHWPWPTHWMRMRSLSRATQNMLHGDPIWPTFAIRTVTRTWRWKLMV